MQNELTDCHFISPHGVEEFDMAPFGRQWFSLNNRSPKILRQLVEKNIGLLEKIIHDKQEELGITNKNTIIVGFSQGSMMGLYLTLSQEEPFAAMVAFSGRLVDPETCQNNATPICVIHGEDDDVVDISDMDHVIEYLKAHKIKYYAHRLPNLTHSIDARGLEIATGFIISALATV